MVREYDYGRGYFYVDRSKVKNLHGVKSTWHNSMCDDVKAFHKFEFDDKLCCDLVVMIVTVVHDSYVMDEQMLKCSGVDRNEVKAFAPWLRGCEPIWYGTRVIL